MKGHVFILKSKCKSVLEFSKTQDQLVRYVTTHFKRSEDIKWMIKNLKETEFEEPKMPTKYNNADINKLMFNKMVENFMSREASYDEAKSKIWEIIWDQCSKALQTKLESLKEFLNMAKENNCVDLLKEIKRLMYQHDGNDYTPLTIYNAKLNSLICKQGSKETVHHYYTRFKGMMDISSIIVVRMEMKLAWFTSNWNRME